MGYNLVLYTIHNISVYKWHRFCKSAFIISYSLFIFKGKNVNLKHKSTIHQIKVTVRHVKSLKSQEGMMPTPRKIFLDAYHTIEMSVKLSLYIICISFKSYWHQHTGKKGKQFPTNPSSEFRFESRRKDGWEHTCVFMSTVRFSAFFCL